MESIQQNKDQSLAEFKKYLELAEDKTVITLLEKLLDNRILEFITEYPSVAYTKEMVKLNTYITTYIQVYNLDTNDVDDVKVIEKMCTEFMLKMTSHKRRRAHEIVNGASRQDSGTQIIQEHRGLKKFLGIK